MVYDFLLERRKCNRKIHVISFLSQKFGSMETKATIYLNIFMYYEAATSKISLQKSLQLFLKSIVI